MTWIKFALWLCVIYPSYYIILVLWDAAKTRRSILKEERHELTFVEHIEPEKLETETRDQIFPSAVMSSGGVSLKQLFSLAREEAIEFTRPVTFS